MALPQDEVRADLRAGLLRRCVAVVVLGSCWFVPAAQAQLPAAGDDLFTSKGMFKLTLSPSYGGGTFVVKVAGPTCVARSGPHLQTADPSGALGDATVCAAFGSPSAATSDTAIGVAPPGFNGGGAGDEVHTEVLDMSLTAPTGHAFTVLAGFSATPATARSLGEVESRTGAGFPADSFFNLFVEVFVPASAGGPLTVFNATPLTVIARGIKALPPKGDDYNHTIKVSGRVSLYDRATGCFVGYFEQGSHRVSRTLIPVGPPPALRGLRRGFPAVFSLDVGAEGLRVPDPCVPPAHPIPNDVYALGMAGLAVVPPSWGYLTEAELFQSAGAPLGAPPNITNVDRMSASLGIQQAPAGPTDPFAGPFSPNPGAPAPLPGPPGGPPGTFGLTPGDNMISLSFGCDFGNLLVFSVDPTAVGAPGTAVEFESTLSPPAPSLTVVAVPPIVPSNGGGDPGDEAAGDLFLSSFIFTPLPRPPVMAFGGFFCTMPGVPLMGLPPAAAGSNLLAYDELLLGLQAPAVAHSALGMPEDDLDALEADDAAVVDANADGIVDPGSFVYFTLAPGSPSVAPFTPNDILITSGAAPFAFGLYASGVLDIGLLGADVIDALALWDVGMLVGAPDGVLVTPGAGAGGDQALFSLAAGSPSLDPAGVWLNPNMPGPGPYSPGDVFYTPFPGPPVGGPITLYASAAMLGLLPPDELDALDVGNALPCMYADNPEFTDIDNDGVADECDNCPNDANPIDEEFGEQLDSDGDGRGDACDECPFEYDPQQDAVCGACCGKECVQISQLECEGFGIYRGDGTRCATEENCTGIPTVSQWGLVVLALLVLTAGTIVVSRQRSARTLV